MQTGRLLVTVQQAFSCLNLPEVSVNAYPPRIGYRCQYCCQFPERDDTWNETGCGQVVLRSVCSTAFVDVWKCCLSCLCALLPPVTVHACSPAWQYGSNVARFGSAHRAREGVCLKRLCHSLGAPRLPGSCTLWMGSGASASCQLGRRTCPRYPWRYQPGSAARASR
jgi:hypothetical protein